MTNFSTENVQVQLQAAAVLGFVSVWGFWHDEERFDLQAEFVHHESPVTVEYGDQSFTIAAGKIVTVEDMWRIADLLIRMSGDLHHVVIEAIRQPLGAKSNKLVMHTGS